jgi:hypothetical protein
MPTAREYNRKRRIIVHEVRMPARHLMSRGITHHGIDGGDLPGIVRWL